MRQAFFTLALSLTATAALAQGAQAPAAPSPGAAPPPLDPPAAVIAKADKDKDGVSSRAEWVAIGNHDAGFTAIDVNKDGKVTVEELTAFRAARAQQAQAKK